MVIEGLNPIIEALSSEAEVEKIIIPAGKRGPRIDKIKELAKIGSVPFFFSPSERNPKAYISEVRTAGEGKVLNGNIVLCLDRIEDPMNLGAIIRSAHAFSSPVVIEKRHSPPLNETVVKASSGVIFSAIIHRTANLPAFILRAKSSEFWVVCAEKSGESLPSFKFPPKSIIVMGSEGKGIRKPVEKLCDFRVSIPMSGDIDSLNVSVAAGIFLYTLRQRV